MLESPWWKGARGLLLPLFEVLLVSPAFHLPNLDYTLKMRTRKEAHTYGLASKSIRITIDASNGSIGVDI